MKENIKTSNCVLIQNNLNQDVIEIKLSLKEINTFLRYKRVLCNNLSKVNIRKNNLIEIKVKYGNNNCLKIFGEQIFVFENNLIEYYFDSGLILQTYILEKAYKNNYDRLKQVVYLDSVYKK